jgi:uncharacterized protein
MRHVVFALLVAVLPAAAQESPVSRAAPPEIVASGEAVIRRVPEVAFVTLSVETRARSPRDAQRQNAELMTAVLRRLEQARVQKEAIRTTGFDLAQEFDFVDNRRVPGMFLAHNSIEVRVDDLARLGDIVDVSVQAGATSVGGIRFDLKDRAAAEREALRLAVADGLARAEAVAAGAGRAIDRVVRVEDLRQEAAPPRPMTLMDRQVTAAETPVAPGQLEILARVTLTAAMK